MNAILLSGGMDSYALMYMHRPALAITIDYGQRPARAEIDSAKQLCEKLSISHSIITADLSALGSGELSDRPAINIAPTLEWWPFRNQLLITLAAMRAVTLGVSELSIGCVVSDARQKDGSAEFVRIINELIQYQEGNIAVNAPAIYLNTAELVIESKIPVGLLAWSHSCHRGNLACGQCRGCHKRRGVMEALGWEVP